MSMLFIAEWRQTEGGVAGDDRTHAFLCLVIGCRVVVLYYTFGTGWGKQDICDNSLYLALLVLFPCIVTFPIVIGPVILSAP